MSIRSSGFSKWMCEGKEVKKDEMRASREGRDSLCEAVVTAGAVSIAAVNAVLAADAFVFVAFMAAEIFKGQWSFKPGG